MSIMEMSLIHTSVGFRFFRSRFMETFKVALAASAVIFGAYSLGNAGGHQKVDGTPRIRGSTANSVIKSMCDHNNRANS